jgi:ribosomal protein S3
MTKQLISNKPYLKALKHYPYHNESSSEYLYHITSVIAYQLNDNEVEVEIKTHLPGILIGKAGVQIKGIGELMEHYSGKKVVTNLIEEDIFDLYED